MRWVRIKNTHINADLIEYFCWHGGKLRIYWLNNEAVMAVEDPDHENYLRLCRALGVAPVEEDSDG